MSFGCNWGKASALKGLNGFNCRPSHIPKFNHQPLKKQLLATNSSKCRSILRMMVFRFPNTFTSWQEIISSCFVIISIFNLVVQYLKFFFLSITCCRLCHTTPCLACRTGVIFLRPIGERRQALGEREGRAQKNKYFPHFHRSYQIDQWISCDNRISFNKSVAYHVLWTKLFEKPFV